MWMEITQNGVVGRRVATPVVEVLGLVPGAVPTLPRGAMERTAHTWEKATRRRAVTHTLVRVKTCLWSTVDLNGGGERVGGNNLHL